MRPEGVDTSGGLMRSVWNVYTA